MAGLITISVFLLPLPGWRDPGVLDPVAKATVVDDCLLLPVFLRNGPITLISDNRINPARRLDIFDQSLHRGFFTNSLSKSWGRFKVPAQSSHPVSHVRIDRQSVYFTTQIPFVEEDPLGKQPIGLLLRHHPLDIERFLRSSNADALDDATVMEIRKLVGRHYSPSLVFHWDLGDPRIQFDYFPARGDRFEFYFSGMFIDKSGGDKRFRILKRVPKKDPEGMNPLEDDGDQYWETPRATEWEEGFTVVGVGEDRYFVTHAGQLFAAPRGKAADLKLKPLATEHPIRILIHDTDFNKTYAFTGSTYFEITDPIQPRRHKIVIPGAPGPLLSQDGIRASIVIAQCARWARGLPEPVAK